MNADLQAFAGKLKTDTTNIMEKINGKFKYAMRHSLKERKLSNVTAKFLKHSRNEIPKGVELFLCFVIKVYPVGGD